MALCGNVYFESDVTLAVFLLPPPQWEDHETLPPLVSDHIFFKHICNLSIQTLQLLCCLYAAAWFRKKKCIIAPQVRFRWHVSVHLVCDYVVHLVMITWASHCCLSPLFRPHNAKASSEPSGSGFTPSTREFEASLVYKNYFQDRLQSYRVNPVLKNKTKKKTKTKQKPISLLWRLVSCPVITGWVHGSTD